MIITPEIIEQIEQSACGLKHGIISLSFQIREGQLSQHYICREESFQHSKKQPIQNDSELLRKAYRIKTQIRMNR